MQCGVKYTELKKSEQNRNCSAGRVSRSEWVGKVRNAQRLEKLPDISIPRMEQAPETASTFQTKHLPTHIGISAEHCKGASFHSTLYNEGAVGSGAKQV